MFPLFGVQNFLGNVGDRPVAQQGDRTSNFGELELGDPAQLQAGTFARKAKTSNSLLK
jgi:hypothetical protein